MGRVWERARDGSSADPRRVLSVFRELLGEAIDLWPVLAELLGSFLDRDRAARRGGTSPEMARRGTANELATGPGRARRENEGEGTAR